MRNRAATFASVGWILLVVSVAVAGPLNWFYDNASGMHFDAQQFLQPISLLGMAMVVAAMVCGVLAKKEHER